MKNDSTKQSATVAENMVEVSCPTRHSEGIVWIYVWFIMVLMVPNLLLCATENLGLAASIANVALPFGVMGLIAVASRTEGKGIWFLFPLVPLSAFQIVLLKLYGRGVIAVDMFLNVATTSGGEAGELLLGLWPLLALMAVAYLPPLWYATKAWYRGNILKQSVVDNIRKCSVALMAVGGIALGVSYLTVPGYSAKVDLYPFNAGYNIWLAAKRTVLSNRYAESSAGYDWNAVPLHGGERREIVVMVIGETSRASNWQLFGYDRATTPLLAKRHGLYAMPQAYSESNTTHKSVPMLLSAVDSRDFDTEIYKAKSLLTAFKEAGYKTAFISNQPHNHSFIDYFSKEADESFFPDRKMGIESDPDIFLTGRINDVLAEENRRQLIVVHTYGSHFNYSDRYDSADRKFLPDDCSRVALSNRQDLVNAYDNTIVATDRFLDTLISMLEKEDCIASLCYTSDHGEDLYDDGVRFLHASPVPTLHQLHVPMIVWLSDEYAERYPDVASGIGKNSGKRVSTSRSFCPTVLGIAGIRTAKTAAEESLTSPDYKECERLYLTDHNKAMPLASIIR